MSDTGPEFQVVPMVTFLRMLGRMCPDCQARARTLLADPMPAERVVSKQVDVSNVISAISSKMRVATEDILGKGNQALYVEARRRVAVELREKGYSLPQIGAAINRHHTTVINLLRTAGVMP